MIEDARMGDLAATTVEPAMVEEDRSMRVLEWFLAALALIAAVGLAFVR